MDPDTLKNKLHFTTNQDVFTPRIRFFTWGAYEVTAWDYPNVYLPCWILHYNMTGGLHLNVNGKEFSPGPEKVLLFPPFTRFSGYMEKPFFQFFSHFHILEPARKVKNEMITLNGSFMQEHLENLLKNANDYEMRSLILHNIILNCYSKIPKKCFLPENKDSMDPRISAILAVIERIPNKNYQVGELAEMAKMSEKHFHRCFVAATGVKPKEYVQMKRLKYARDLLSQTDKSIEEIAESASFANRYHFSQVFKKTYQFSPGEYKRKYGLKKFVIKEAISKVTKSLKSYKL